MLLHKAKSLALFFFAVLGIEPRALSLARQVLYPLSHDPNKTSINLKELGSYTVFPLTTMEIKQKAQHSNRKVCKTY
jgi:hypothetical protein